MNPNKNIQFQMIAKRKMNDVSTYGKSNLILYDLCSSQNAKCVSESVRSPYNLYLKHKEVWVKKCSEKNLKSSIFIFFEFGSDFTVNL